MVATINAIKENPSLAQFQFRSETEWVNGAHSRTKIQGFYGAGAEDTSRKKPFVVLRLTRIPVNEIDCIFCRACEWGDKIPIGVFYRKRDHC